MNLINTLKKNPNVRKLFGKREIEIIEKQLLGIKLKSSEKTRLSRDIKKKFEAIHALSGNISEFDLKKGQRIKERIENAKEVILKSSYLPKIKKIVLFGSTAENARTFRSDIDISIEFSEMDKHTAFDFRKQILGQLGDDMDIQVYNILPNKIKKEIDNFGKVLYESKK